jgi:hypothetical protein
VPDFSKYQELFRLCIDRFLYFLAQIEWISNNTSTDDNFIDFTELNIWFIKSISEWFPALSGRISVATVQGSEWLPDHGYSNQISRYEKLQNCADKDYPCIFSWAIENNISLSYLWVSKKYGEKTGVGQAAIVSLLSSEKLKLVFDNPSASIFQIGDDQ